jgi:hypothetical protein
MTYFNNKIEDGVVLEIDLHKLAILHYLICNSKYKNYLNKAGEVRFVTNF